MGLCVVLSGVGRSDRTQVILGEVEGPSRGICAPRTTTPPLHTPPQAPTDSQSTARLLLVASPAHSFSKLTPFSLLTHHYGLLSSMASSPARGVLVVVLLLLLACGVSAFVVRSPLRQPGSAQAGRARTHVCSTAGAMLGSATHPLANRKVQFSDNEDE